MLPHGGTVYLLGCAAALSVTIEDQLVALGYHPVRLAGANPFATAVAVAEHGPGDPDSLVVADGQQFTDSILTGTAAVEGDEALTAEDPSSLSVIVAERCFPTPRVVGMATTAAFADALAGGARVTRDDIGPGPILLSASDHLPTVIAQHLADIRAGLERVVLFGGNAALTQDVESAVRHSLG